MDEPGRETIPHPPYKRIKPTQAILFFSFLVGFIIIGTTGLFAYLFSLAQTTSMTIVVDREARIIHTRAETVGELLSNLNIPINEGDTLSAKSDAPIYEGMVILIEKARSVTVSVDDESRVLRTTLTNPAQILSHSGVTLSPDDRVMIDGTETDPLQLADWPVPVRQIDIRRASNIAIDDNGTITQVRTAGENVGEVLYDAGITLYVADAVSPELNAPVTPDMTITIERSQPATIIADGVTLETRTRGGTVADLLADAGVSLMGLDYVIPGEQTPMQPGMSVRVIRVREQVIKENEIIPFESESQPDPALEIDQARLVQAGENGLRQTIIRVRYENGAEVARENEGEFIVREPKNRIVAYGTGVVLRTVETEDGPRPYWRKIRMLVTSYHPAALGGDNVTATGRILRKGIVGVDPTVIPYGTEIYVPGYGVGVAADTGGPRSTRLWIDLGYDDENYRPWSGYTDVYILGPVPDNIKYVLPD